MNQRSQRYVTSRLWKKGERELFFNCDVSIHPTHILTGATRQGIGIIDGIYMPTNQLITPIDTWFWSVEFRTDMIDKFNREHGLYGKSDDYIEDYLDERGISRPDPNRVTLPVFEKLKPVRMTGMFTEDIVISLMGYGARSL